MSAPVVYRSSDASAPTLSGTAGELVNLLDKCLVTGYGVKAAAGWTKPYTDTNKAVFRQGGGSLFYLDVNDAAPGAAGAREARIRGYETMTAVATGTYPFPTVAQEANGLFPRKSVTADTTVREWIVVADDRTLYVFIRTGDSAGVFSSWSFGDIYSLLPSDKYACAIIGRNAENNASVIQTAEPGATNTPSSNPFINITGHYAARNYNGQGGSVGVCKQSDASLMSTSSNAVGVGIASFPNPSDNSILLSRLYIGRSDADGIRTRRGWLRGFWHSQHPIASFTHEDTFNGTGDLAGRTFLVIKSLCTTGLAVIETSNTWDTH